KLERKPPVLKLAPGVLWAGDPDQKEVTPGARRSGLKHSLLLPKKGKRDVHHPGKILTPYAQKLYYANVVSQKIRIALAVGSFLFCFVGFAAPPVALDAFFTTVRDTPVQVLLTGIDEDVDPDHPEVHPLTFAIVTPPAHGSLSGDITAVKYEAPHKAVVILIYTPELGFVGTDSFTYIVTEPLGFFATGVVRIDVARPPAPP
ncbi:MAG: Ig-like domain-containing protein, partial [Chloroflexi bacterium]|nr:Ig-like domain-containing protein [Chloroflexota bacterium]